MTKCRHAKTTCGRDRCYTGPVSRDENPAAHGGIRYTETCATCGYEREVNANGFAVERGPWTAPEAAVESIYTTWGEVRGGCHHVHLSHADAVACVSRDRAGCRRQGGYSDREVRGITRRESATSYDTTRGPGEPAPA